MAYRGRLYRSRTNEMVSGVCAGIADYFDIDVTLVRVFWVIAALSGGFGIIAYIAAAIIIPEEPKDTANGIDAAGQTVIDNGEAPRVRPAIGGNNAHSESNRRLGGIILAGFGFILLADQFVHWADFDRLWPLLIVIAGLALAFRGFGGDK